MVGKTFQTKTVTRTTLSNSEARRKIESLIAKDRTKLLDLAWYIQYKLPFSQRENAQDDGIRALVFPSDSTLLPVISIIPANQEIDLTLSNIAFYNTYILPQISEVGLMLDTFQSMYRVQKKILQDMGVISFHRQLTTLSYCRTLNYDPYLFPDHPSFMLDIICPECGSVHQHNTYFDTEYKNCFSCGTMIYNS